VTLDGMSFSKNCRWERDWSTTVCAQNLEMKLRKVSDELVRFSEIRVGEVNTEGVP